MEAAVVIQERRMKKLQNNNICYAESLFHSLARCRPDQQQFYIPRKNILTQQRVCCNIIHIKSVGIIGNVLKRRVSQRKQTEIRLNAERAFMRSLAEVHLGTTDRTTVAAMQPDQVGSGGYARYSITV